MPALRRAGAEAGLPSPPVGPAYDGVDGDDQHGDNRFPQARACHALKAGRQKSTRTRNTVGGWLLVRVVLR